MADPRGMIFGALALLGASACGGCVADGEPSTFALPMKTLAPVRLVPCPERVAAAAVATRCPEVSR